MSVPSRLMRTAREAFAPSAREALAYAIAIRLFRLVGVWRYPARANGDFEEMKFLDIAYWLHKAERPISEPFRGSKLREHFAVQEPRSCRVPRGFVESSRLRVSAAGDLMNHAYVAASQDTLYSEVADLIFDADVSMANLECVVTAGPRRGLDLNTKEAPALSFTPDEFAVISGGRNRFDVLATACNHSLDFGLPGVTSTISALRERAIDFAGINEDAESAKRATIIERGDIRIAVIAVAFGLNGKVPLRAHEYLVNRTNLNGAVQDVDLSLFESQLAHCRSKDVDFVIAQLHWGMEHEYFPRPSQVQLAHLLAEMGVDAIFGHHPHVIQPSEYYRTSRDPERVVPICYSLGNLTTPFSATFLCESVVATLVLAKGRTKDGDTRTYVSSLRLTKVIQTADDRARTLSLRRQENS
jgi:poly-gamma-glutamate capsule biosynthesis protein CapA/YwtB (metallophosphatase superfamily)